MEMQDLGTKLRMVVMAHRRITLKQKHEETEAKTTSLDPEIIGSDEMPLAFNAKPENTIEALLQVETENLLHEPFETTDEVKALTQEIIKTIRDIIVSVQYFS